MDYQETFVQRDQHRIYVRDHPGAEPAIILMHGFPENVHLYDRLSPYLSPPRRVVLFDFLGWGSSDKPSGYPYATDNQVGDLKSFKTARNHALRSPRAFAQARLRRDLQQSYIRHHMLSAWHRADIVLAFAVQQGARAIWPAPRLSRRWEEQCADHHRMAGIDRTFRVRSTLCGKLY
jgi:hypothetical protein